MTPQAQLVLGHLTAHGSITNVEAHIVHKVRSVSARITEIRNAGYNVEKEQRSDVTGQRYVKYVLKPAPKALYGTLAGEVLDFAQFTLRAAAHARAAA